MFFVEIDRNTIHEGSTNRIRQVNRILVRHQKEKQQNATYFNVRGSARKIGEKVQSMKRFEIPAKCIATVIKKTKDWNLPVAVGIQNI